MADPRSRRLTSLAKGIEDVAIGLYAFRDVLPRHGNEDVTAAIGKLFNISALLHRIDQIQQDPHYGPSFYRVRDDIGLLIVSLQLTVDVMLNMFARAVNLPHQVVWDDMCHRMEQVEGLGLQERLGCYHDCLQAQTEVIRGAQPPALRDLRRQLQELLNVQDSTGLHGGRPTLPGPMPTPPPLPSTRPSPRPILRPPSRPPSRPPLIRFQSPSTPSAFSDEWDYARRPPPTAPEAPTSPTTTNSSQTLDSSHISYFHDPQVPPVRLPEVIHWARVVFESQYPRTPIASRFLLDVRSECRGTPDPSALTNIAHDRFIRALQLSFDRDRLWVRLYWRPQDERARILIITHDAYGEDLYHCIPLTNLRIFRDRSSLQLCRVRANGDYSLWALLNFDEYETMALFYCTFIAMKHQDHRPLPGPFLLDHFQLRGDDGEATIFSGIVQDGPTLHALRLFEDRTSGVLRLEVCDYQDHMRDVPLWTAFVTRYVGDPGWAEYQGGGVVSLIALRPAPCVFVAGYEVPSRLDGEYVLQFTTAKDAKDFVEIWMGLCRRASPRR